jgi:hypothetical protein
MQAARQRQGEALAAAFGDVVTLDEEEVAAAVSVRAGSVENQDGGQRSTSVLTARILKSVLETAPPVRSKIGYDDKTWIIDTVAGAESWSQEHVITAYL